MAVVNDAFVKAIWPGQSAIGKRFRFGGNTGRVIEIVGVVRGMQDLLIGESPKPYIFLPVAQAYRTPMTILVAHCVGPNLGRAIHA